MTEENLTELGREIVGQLRKVGRWTTRKELSVLLNRPRGLLAKYDITLLNRLIAAGVIEARKKRTGTVKFVWFYRAAPRPEGAGSPLSLCPQCQQNRVLVEGTLCVDCEQDNEFYGTPEERQETEQQDKLL